MHANAWEQPTANEGTDYANEEVANNSEARPPNDFTSQPARNDADEQYDQEALV